MRHIVPIFKREFLGYFRSPVAYVFLIAFLFISVSLAFSRYGGFFRAGVAGMDSYFTFFPWLFMFLVPAVGMRLWSEEKRSGTVELLFTLPITTLEAVLGKFLAGWAFLTIAVLLSFPMALTVGYLGDPDWGVILTTYLGAVLMAGGYLGVCALASALTKNQLRHQPRCLRRAAVPRLQQLHRHPRGAAADGTRGRPLELQFHHPL